MSEDTKKRSKISVAQRIKYRVRVFRSDETGTMIIFGLFIFVIMLVAGGMAVDFMRFERERARVQYTLDRAILAAGSLSQPLDPKTVVDDYFAKSGLANHKVKTTPSSGVNYKTVHANAQTEMNTFFINLLGTPSMKASARGGSEERRQKIELSLVLDVSGSMGNNSTSGGTKLAELKSAAKEFLDTILTEDTKDKVSVSIIPYNMQVNVGPEVITRLAAQGRMDSSTAHDYSHCIDFDANDFGSVTLTGSGLEQTGHFDPFYHTIDHPYYSGDNDDTRLFMCPSSAESEIMLFSQDKEKLKNKIDSLGARGNTSIDIGMKWGAYFLDSGSNSLVSALPSSTGVDPVFATRPAAYSDNDTLKIMVVMTDGVNTTQYTLDEDYASGNSPVYLDSRGSGGGDDDWITMRNYWGSGDEAWFITRTYNRDANNNGYYDKYFDDNRRAHHDNRLTWQELWDVMGVKYYAYYQLYRQKFNGNRYYDLIDDAIDEVSGSQKDSRLLNVCSAARQKDMVIYTIGFEVTNHSAGVMNKCAGGTDDEQSANFFRVSGNGISDAFNSIAKTIQQLKLTH